MASINEIKALIDQTVLSGGGRTIASTLRTLLKTIADSYYNKTDSPISPSGVSSVNAQTPDGAGNVLLTTANIADSVGKRYQTENQNTFNDATSSIQTQLNGKQKQFSLKGLIIDENFNSSFSNYTSVGSATWSIVSNMLQAAGGTTFTLSNYVRHSNWGDTCIINNTMIAEVIVGTIGANTHGVGISFQSTANGGNKSNHFVLRLNTGNQGQLQSFIDNSTASTYQVNAVDALTVTAGDRVRLQVDIVGNEYIFTVTNLTNTSTQPVTLSRTVSPVGPATYTNYNTGQFALNICGGTHSFDLHQVYSNEVVSPDIIFVGDSIPRGAGVINQDLAFPSQLAKLSNAKVSVWSGGGNRAIDIKGLDVLRYTPRNVIVSVGINDIIGGRSASQIVADINTFITALGGDYTLGTNLFICEVLPNVTYASQVVTVNTALQTNFAVGLIRTYASFDNGAGAMQSIFINDSSADDLHPNHLGHKQLANVIYQDLVKRGIAEQNTTPKSNSLPVYSFEGFTPFGKSQFVPQAAVNAIDSTYQIFFGADADNPLNGGNLISSSYSVAALGVGGYFNGSSYISSGTLGSVQLFMNNGSFAIRSKTGVAAGAAFSYDTYLSMNATGNFCIGVSGDSTWRSTNGGSDANAQMLFEAVNSKTTSAAQSVGVLTSGVAGLVSNGTNRIRIAQFGFIVTGQTAGSESGVAVIYTKPSGSAIVEAARFDNTQNMGVGTLANAIGARIHAISTTQQLRLGFDASNYLSATVGSAGSVTLDLVGTTPKFTFNKAIVLGSGVNIESNTGTGTIIFATASQKGSFWGAAAIVQPTTAVTAATFAANTSGILNDTATFDGYTIGKVVKALRNIGLLA